MRVLSKGFIPRTEFPPHNVPLANFAAHHRRALADLRALAPQVDIVLELRDARAPISSINPLLHQALPGVPKLTLYSKWDLSPLRKSHVSGLHPDGMFRLVSMDERKYASRLRRELAEWAEAQEPKPPLGYKVLIAGMPNAGKSSLINKFRQVLLGRRAKRVVRTGSNPGITRAVSEQIMISDTPRIYVLDTPGVLMPQVNNWEQMLKLCLIGAVPRKLVDPVVLADYLLFQMNRWYPNGGRYPGPLSNEIEPVLWALANTMRRKPSRDSWDPNHTADEWVDRFTRGGIGRINMDNMSIDAVEEELARVNSLKYDLGSLLPAGKNKFTRKSSRFI